MSDDERALCQVCGQVVLVTMRGLLRRHKAGAGGEAFDRETDNTCSGSGTIAGEQR